MMMMSLPTAAVISNGNAKIHRHPHGGGYRVSPPSSTASDHAHDDDHSTGSTLSVHSEACGLAAEHLRNTSMVSSPGSMLGSTPVLQRRLHDAYHGQHRQATPPPPPAYFATPAVSQTPAKPSSHAAATSTTTTLPKRSAPKAPYRHNPYAPLPAAAAAQPARNAAPVMHGISHQPLVGNCRYISWPEISPLPSTAGADVLLSGLPRLVIDQVKFELTAAQLRWLIHKLSGVVAVHVVALERGGFAAYFKTEAERARAQVLHRAILFDHHGAWAPSNAAESACVSRYMGSREFRQRGQRLPRELMTLIAKSTPSSSSAASTTSPLLPPY